jgi:hypothetical protein
MGWKFVPGPRRTKSVRDQLEELENRLLESADPAQVYTASVRTDVGAQDLAQAIVCIRHLETILGGLKSPKRTLKELEAGWAWQNPY